MKLFRHPGLMIAVFWCAAMVMAPMAAAAGSDQSMNQGNNQIQQGNGQNTAGPGQGNGPQRMGRGNATGFGNMTPFASGDGNMTAPPDKPDWGPDNSTAMNMTGWHGRQPGNMTGMNMTDIPPPMKWDSANMTAINHTWHSDGNQTLPAPPQQQNGADHGQQMNQSQQQTQNRNNSGNSLIDELIAWLKDQGIS
jgi:hypothetical protein